MITKVIDLSLTPHGSLRTTLTSPKQNPVLSYCNDGMEGSPREGT